MSDAKQLYLTPDELDSIFTCVNFYKHKTDGECDQSPKTELSEILFKINRPLIGIDYYNDSRHLDKTRRAIARQVRDDIDNEIRFSRAYMPPPSLTVENILKIIRGD